MATALGGVELFIVLLVVGFIVAAAIIGWERYQRTPPPATRPTAEVFIDPESGRRMRVWEDPATGIRDYRAD